MEERLMDDEYGKGVKLKKTEEGYVDVTDAAYDEEEGEEISFEFPVLDTDEDDEDLVSLSPEEALKLRQKKEAAAQARRAEYERLCGEGEKLLETGSYRAAELKFERALSMDETATEATVGYWRAKTSDFDDPNALLDEYADEGVENMEYDLGYEAVAILKEQFRDKLQVNYEKVAEEKARLAEVVEESQVRRRGVLKSKRLKTAIAFGVSAVVTVLVLVWAIYFASMNVRVNDGRYIPWTIAFGVVFLICFIVFGVCTNKFINACRIHNANERLSSTEEGARVELLREYKELYEYLLA